MLCDTDIPHPVVMRRNAIYVILIFLTQWSLHGFSPYELYLESGLERQVMLCARIVPEERERFEANLERLSTPPVQKRLQEAGIREVVVMERALFGESAVFVRFLYAGALPYLEAAERFSEAIEETGLNGSVGALIDTVNGSPPWHQMEWINHIRGDRSAGKPTQRVGIICEIRPEKEGDYRALHQSVWPGVVDQVVRGRIRDLGVFLIPFQGRLLEVLYLDYMGNDGPADDAANKKDLTNQRWWRHTDACQRPLPDVAGGIWSGMEMLFPASG